MKAYSSSFTRGVPFVTTDGTTLGMDLFAPPSVRKNRAALVFLHGGGFTGGTRDQFLAAAAYLSLQTGAVCVTLDYRVAPRYLFPAPVLDCLAVCGWLTEQRQTLGIDPEKLCVVGGSPGANIGALAMLGGWNKEQPCGTSPPLFRPKNAILLNGIFDLSDFYSRNPKERGSVEAYLGLEKEVFPPSPLTSVESWRSSPKPDLFFYPDTAEPSAQKAFSEMLHAASPIHHCRGGVRVLLLHGDEDGVVPPAQSKAMEQRLIRCGSSAKLLVFKGEGHAWFNDPAKQFEVIQRMENFINEF